MIKLFEDYKNLNAIDISLLHKWGNKTMSLKNLNITPNSKIVINPINPHKFSTIPSIIEDDKDIAAIIVRAHHKQLLIIIPQREITHKWTQQYTNFYYYKNKKYFVRFSDFAYRKCNSKNYDEQVATNSEASLKTIISNTVKDFYNNVASEGIVKNWDCMIVYSDPNVQELRTNRSKSRENMVLVPSDPEYKDYILSLQNAFKQRAEQWIDNHRFDAQNEKDVKTLFNNINIQKIKFKGQLYQLNFTDMTEFPNLEYIYKNISSTGLDDYPTYIIVEMQIEGLKLKILRIVGSKDIPGTWNREDRIKLNKWKSN